MDNLSCKNNVIVI